MVVLELWLDGLSDTLRKGQLWPPMSRGLMHTIDMVDKANPHNGAA